MSEIKRDLRLNTATPLSNLKSEYETILIMSRVIAVLQFAALITLISGLNRVHHHANYGKEYFGEKTEVSYEGARSYCDTFNSKMFAPTSLEEFNFVIEHFEDLGSFWIGASTNDYNSNYVYANGQRFKMIRDLKVARNFIFKGVQVAQQTRLGLIAVTNLRFANAQNANETYQLENKKVEHDSFVVCEAVDEADDVEYVQLFNFR